MTVSELRRRVDALCRKYATELRIYRLRRLALEFCDEMAEAVQNPKPEKPRSITDWAKLLFDRAKERNVRLKTFVHLASYLEKCLEKRVLPQVNDVLRSLLPREAAKGLIPRSVPDRPLPRRASLHSGLRNYLKT